MGEELIGLAGNPDGGQRGLISVVIPTHDRCLSLRESIESVLASDLIASPDQIVVVDDDSTDTTAAVAEQFAVKYIRVACHSTATSRNTGLAVVDSPYVAFLDDDDVWLPGNIEPQLAALQSHPHAALAYGMAQCADEDLRPILGCFPTPPLPSGLDPDRFHLSYPQLGVVLFRREFIAECGGFNPRIRYGEDGELMLRIAAEHEVLGVEFVGMLHRLRSPSRQRSDYFWAKERREVTRWKPRHIVRRPVAKRFCSNARKIFYWGFYGDAKACASLGDRRSTVICLWRALRISPARGLRHSLELGSTLLAISKRPGSPRPGRNRTGADLAAP
jgi:glycosyltransferase involved in cell wall biosynthesis